MTNYFRYGAWDGSQHVLDVDAEALLDAMSDDLLEEGDLWRALQRLFRQGAQNREGQRFPGLQDLLQQLRQKRQQQLQRSNLGDTLKDIREKLQQIQHTERQGIDKKVDDGRQKAQSGEIPPQLQQTLERMAQEQLDQLDQVPRLLEEAGLVERKGDQLELTPRAIRKIGQKALRDIFQHLARDRFGEHEADRRGLGGDRSDETKAYEFGDPFLLDLRGTLHNSLVRRGSGTPVRLDP